MLVGIGCVMVVVFVARRLLMKLFDGSIERKHQARWEFDDLRSLLIELMVAGKATEAEWREWLTIAQFADKLYCERCGSDALASKDGCTYIAKVALKQCQKN